MKTATLLNRGGNFKYVFEPGLNLVVLKTSISKEQHSTPAMAVMRTRGKEISLTCTADGPLYFLFLPWTSLPIFPSFGNTPSLFPTSCGRNPADPEEAALSFQSAAPGISAARWVELGSLMKEAHIHSGQWKQMRIECCQPKLQTLQHTSASAATPAGSGFQVLWWDTAVGTLTSATTCLCLRPQHPPTHCPTNRYGKGSGLCWAHVSRPASPFLSHPLPGRSTTSGSEWSPWRRCCVTIWAAAPFAALKNCRLNKHPLGRDQPADCQVDHAGWYYHVHHGNNLVINSRGIIHHNCAQMSFRICPISAREGTGVLYMHSPIFYSEYRGKSAPIFRVTIWKFAQGSRDWGVFINIKQNQSIYKRICSQWLSRVTGKSLQISYHCIVCCLPYAQLLCGRFFLLVCWGFF